MASAPQVHQAPPHGLSTLSPPGTTRQAGLATSLSLSSSRTTPLRPPTYVPSGDWDAQVFLKQHVPFHVLAPGSQGRVGGQVGRGGWAGGWHAAVRPGKHSRAAWENTAVRPGETQLGHIVGIRALAATLHGLHSRHPSPKPMPWSRHPHPITACIHTPPQSAPAFHHSMHPCPSTPPPCITCLLQLSELEGGQLLGVEGRQNELGVAGDLHPGRAVAAGRGGVNSCSRSGALP